MQNGQVSVWVPIVVGVIGFLGIISGQLVNARRERLKTILEEENRRSALWRDKKTELYVSMIDLCHDAIGLANRAASGNYPYPDTLQKLSEFGEVQRKIEALNPRMLLLASNDVYGAYSAVSDRLVEFFQTSADEVKSNPDFSTTKSIKLDEKIKETVASTGRMLRKMRNNLGIPIDS